MVGTKVPVTIEPVDLDFELTGRAIVANPIISWYYSVARKFAKLKESENKILDLDEILGFPYKKKFT